MASPDLAARLRAGETLIGSWNVLAEPMLAEGAARAGFDCVALDMQHGLHDLSSITRGIEAVVRVGKSAIVRVPIGDYAAASYALDVGAAAVVAPMINSSDDARTFVAAMKFPPIGERSWGPVRAMPLHGVDSNQTYLETANQATLALAMIETEAALQALDDILAVDGIDGVLVGPSDLSISLSHGAKVDPRDHALDDTIRPVAERTIAAGKVPAIFAVDAELAVRFRDFGFKLICIGSEQAYLSAGVRAVLAMMGRTV